MTQAALASVALTQYGRGGMPARVGAPGALQSDLGGMGHSGSGQERRGRKRAGVGWVGPSLQGGFKKFEIF